MLIEALRTSSLTEVIPFNARFQEQIAGIGSLFEPFLGVIQDGLRDLGGIPEIAPRVLQMGSSCQRISGIIQKVGNRELFAARSFGSGWELDDATYPYEGADDVSDSQMKAALSAAMRHELGNPTASIRGYF